MAKSEVRVRAWRPGSHYYDIWIGEELIPELKAIRGTQQVSKQKDLGPAPYWFRLRSGYHADDVIAEIEALGKPVEDERVILIDEQARALARAAIKQGSPRYVARAYLKVIAEEYRYAQEALRDIGLTAERLLDGTPPEEAGEPVEEAKKPTLGEMARALGRKVGEEGKLYYMAKEFLVAADKYYIGGCLESTLWDLSKLLARRLEHGHW